MRRFACLLLLVSVVTITVVDGSAGGRTTTASAPLARWSVIVHMPRVVDLTAPRGDGAVLAATSGRLALFYPPSTVKPFATGPGGYASPGGGEPYVTLLSGQTVAGAHCSFSAGALYALRLVKGPGVTVVDAAGHARLFVSLPTTGLENGIAFDRTGRFGHRLLVSSILRGVTTVFAIDCRGHFRAITSSAPQIEGGMVVAPRAFGSFGGDLIAADEFSGHLLAIAPDGSVRLVANSGLPVGRDIGIESAGFVPAGFVASWSALVADRAVPHNPHPGDDAVLRASGGSLIAAGVKPGDLLVATEGGGQTDAVRCPSACSVRHVANGPSIAHVEGHISFVP